MTLKPDESDLIGAWVFEGGRTSGDGVEIRIGELIERHLTRVAVSPESGGWDTLFRDPADGRFWELTYPQSEMHGGGPKRLTNISFADAVTKFQIKAD